MIDSTHSTHPTHRSPRLGLADRSLHRGLALLVLPLALLAAGCTRSGEAEKEHDHAHGSAHDHDHDHDHGHDHAPGGSMHGDDHAHGEEVDLGAREIGDFSVQVVRYGDVTAGGEVALDAFVAGDRATIVAVRSWVGVRDAAGSVRAKLDPEGDGWHGHVEAPAPMPAGSRLWIEIEIAGGDRLVGDFDLKVPGA